MQGQEEALSYIIYSFPVKKINIKPNNCSATWYLVKSYVFCIADT